MLRTFLSYCGNTVCKQLKHEFGCDFELGRGNLNLYGTHLLTHRQKDGWADGQMDGVILIWISSSFEGIKNKTQIDLSGGGTVLWHTNFATPTLVTPVQIP